MSSHRFPGLICCGFLLAALALGCAGSGAHRSAAGGVAPGLRDDGPSHGRAGTNPNAPFTLIDRTPRPSATLATMTPQDASACLGKDLALTEVAADADGDTHTVKFAFVNQAPVACRLGGYPSIALFDEQGQPVASVIVNQTGNRSMDAHTAPASAAIAGNTTPPQIVLEPNGEAYFAVGWTSGDECPLVSKVTMTAPGTAQTFTISRPLRVCAGQVHVTALQSTQNAS